MHIYSHDSTDTHAFTKQHIDVHILQIATNRYRQTSLLPQKNFLGLAFCSNALLRLV